MHIPSEDRIRWTMKGKDIVTVVETLVVVGMVVVMVVGACSLELRCCR